MAEGDRARPQGDSAGGGAVSRFPQERTVEVNGHACRVWEAGEGDTVGYLAGLIGQPAWSPFLDRLAERHHVVVPSIPGFFGATGYEDLDNSHDWAIATLDLLQGAGLLGAPMVASSFGATLAAEVAAVNPAAFPALVLVAPLGHYDDDHPVPHIWATTDAERHALLANDQDALKTALQRPDDEDPTEWPIKLVRSNAAAARLLWPMCDIGLVKRLHRISVPTRLVWGEDDRILDVAYAEKLAKLITGPVDVRTVASAGHLVDIDQPAALARLVLEHLEERR